MLDWTDERDQDADRYERGKLQSHHSASHRYHLIAP
jgi:hypothetical protein